MVRILLFMIGVLCALPSVVAQDFEYTYEGQTLTYTVLDENAKTCQLKAGRDYTSTEYPHPAGNEVSGDLIIPSVAAGYSVVKIPDKAFYWCTELNSVQIPNSVTSIGTDAFEVTNLNRSYSHPR